MMASWRDQVLKEFTPQVARLTLVADPDGLLLEEGVLKGIRDRGFELIPFEDHVAFRFAYESKFRSRWDRGEPTDLVVVLRSELGDLNSLPYDLLQAGRKLSFDLGDLFPNLSYPVVAEMDRGDLDALYQAQLHYPPGKQGDNGTKDFALRHVFEIAPELVKQPADLLRILLRRHYREQRVPRVLDERLIQVLRQGNCFEGWPLEQIVPDKTAFLAFLQERWPVFLGRVATGSAKSVRERAAHYDLEFSGPSDLPFDHDDVRVYVDNLFLEGLLQPVAHDESETLAGQWVAVGVRRDQASDRLRRFEGLLRSLEGSVPSDDAKHQDWLLFAQRWAEFSALCAEMISQESQEVHDRTNSLRVRLDAAFLAWVQDRYAGLYNQPPVPPVMVHHVPRTLARQREDAQESRIALLLVDGLALDQWVTIRNVLRTQRPPLRFSEDSVFAWVPTITSVSRQAAFAGKPPLYFPSSIYTTDREESLWAQFWADHGLVPREVAFLKGLGDGELDRLVETVLQPNIRVLGLVLDKIDKIMHGMELGSAGMHNQVRQWAEQGFLASLLDLLLGHGFQVTLTSDHGNVEARGCGHLSEGVIADLRGERARVYSDKKLRSVAGEHFPAAIEWPAVGLPEDFLALLAPDRCAFIGEEDRVVAHGGISIEELVVPFVQFEG